MEARPLIATPQTDAILRKRYWKLGAKAQAEGVKREACPCNGMIKGWWLEGWDWQAAFQAATPIESPRA